MIASLPLFHRVAGQPVVVLGSGQAAQAKRRLVERAGAVIVDDLQAGIDQGARLAFIAHDDAALAEADSARARHAGLLVNATDRPELCDFTVPSVLDRSPVLLAIGTGGASAGLAKQLRLRLEALLPGSLGALAQALYSSRSALRSRWPDSGDRRRALDSALGEGGVLDPLKAGSSDQLNAWLTDTAQTLEEGRFEIVLRSDDPDDLTLREMRWLGAADRIWHDADVPADILDRARADAPRLVIGEADLRPEEQGLTVVIRR